MTDNPQSTRFEDRLRNELGESGGWEPGALGATEANEALAKDHLTKLESRIEMGKNFQEITKKNKIGCLLFVDIDNFKGINDTHGHEIGDVVLENLGLRLLRSISKTDHTGRWGGEEFLVILEELDDLEVAKQRAEEIKVSIGTNPVSIGNLVLPNTVSIGVALRKPGEKSKEWIGRADEAMYLAKKSGRNQVKTEDDL